MAEGSHSSTSSKGSNSGDMGFGMRATILMVRTKFSKVEDVSTETLHGWLQGQGQTDDKNIVLMDCRDESEYLVSHLAGSRRVDWEHDDPQKLLSSIPPGKPSTVVCYCSVGYRSSAVADKLQKYLQSSEKGEKEGAQSIQVFNLEGSLFKWANEGRPMVTPAGQSTPLCHPYNAVWGKLLHKHLRSSDASSKV